MDTRTWRTVLVACMLGALSACSTVAPRYNSAPGNVNVLRDANLAPARVGEFTADPKSKDAVNALSARANPYVSPYDGSFVAYVREALRQELDDARLLDPRAAIVIGGVVLRNELNAAGMVTGDAQLEVRFVVTRGGQVRFDKVKSAKHEWESHFAGAIAIPRAFQEYPVVVRQLLASLYSDPDFTGALRK
jgi:hypothetical protein